MHRKLRDSWSVIRDLDDTVLAAIFAQSQWGSENKRWSPERLIELVHELRDGSTPDDEDLRRQEYEALLEGYPDEGPGEQFVCLRVDLDADSPISHHIRHVRQVSRLREVSALISFSRLQPSNPTDATASSLSESPPSWLPATEIFGEGIFIVLDPDRLKDWELLGPVRARADRIEGAARESFQQPVVTARGLLLHSVAHALMLELSMDAGYPVASLRERVYDGQDQAGVLIYTATADSAGSLGGLSSQSEQHRLTEVLLNAIRRAQWCTSDPVCIESTGAGIDNLNLAACHACLLVPETSCERRNTQLDRALLVGTQGAPESGFFSGLLML